MDTSERLVDLARQHTHGLTTTIIAKQFGFSRQYAHTLVSNLVSCGFLIKQGSTRGARYFLSDGTDPDFLHDKERGEMIKNRDVVTTSTIILGPPGVGKTYLTERFPGHFIDPEKSISWKAMDMLFNPYSQGKPRDIRRPILEHELQWNTVWIKEVLPRILTAFLLRKDIVMGMVTPSNVEVVSCFLEGLQERTVVFLPERKEHYRRFLQEQRRPRFWGSMVRGWQNTFWVRLLLQGLAREIGLPIVKSPKIHSAKRKQQSVLAVRDEVDFQGRRFLEIVFGRWVELDHNEEIVALYHQEKVSGAFVELQCEKKSRRCEEGKHDCTRTKQVSLKPDWIATDKLKTLGRGKKKAVIFFAGSMAPFHQGHLGAMNAAKRHLQEEGWQVIGGYVSVLTDLWSGRRGGVYPMIGSLESRTIMLQLGVRSSDWIMPDYPVQHILSSELLRAGKHPVQRVAHRLRENGAIGDDEQITTFWVNGKDAFFQLEFFSTFATFADHNKKNPLRMLIVDNREGKNLWSKQSIQAFAPQLEPYIFRCQSRGVHPTSATKVRAALETGNRMALREAVGIPMVEAYLMGLMADTA